MKGIILSGGKGTRLYPLTVSVSKQLLPVYDKPMIYYPLSILMISGIKEILIITTPDSLENYKQLLGDGSKVGISINYAVQEKPEGLAQAFTIGEDFIGDDDVCLILGDNLFYGAGIQTLLKQSIQTVKETKKAVIFGYYVDNPENYGVAEFDDKNNVLSIEEKPKKPKSNFAIVGLYFYPNNVVEISKKVNFSDRGELEITSVNQKFLNNKKLILNKLSRGYAWLDTGTQESLSEASEFVKAIEKRTGLKIGCIEEIAFKMNWISKNELLRISQTHNKSEYTDYLKKISQ